MRTELTRTPCSVVHLDSLMRVDVILPRPAAFETAMRVTETQRRALADAGLVAA